MTYFNTRRTGDIQRRLAGIWEVREFLVEHGVAALTACGPARGRAGPDAGVQPAAHPGVPGHGAALHRADAVLVALAPAAVRRAGGYLREVPVVPDRRDQGDRDGQGARGGACLPRPDAPAVQLRRPEAVRGRLHDDALPRRDSQRSPCSPWSSSSGGRAPGDGGAAVHRRPRRLQCARGAGQRADSRPAGHLGQPAAGHRAT